VSRSLADWCEAETSSVLSTPEQSYWVTWVVRLLKRENSLPRSRVGYTGDLRNTRYIDLAQQFVLVNSGVVFLLS
jgi:hypothetical protein